MSDEDSTGHKVDGTWLVRLCHTRVIQFGACWPGVKAKICIGVIEDERGYYWQGHWTGDNVSSKVLTEFRVMKDFDVILLMSAEVAISIVTRGVVPPDHDLLLINGDRSLIPSFAQHYLQPTYDRDRVEAQRNPMTIECFEALEVPSREIH